MIYKKLVAENGTTLLYVIILTFADYNLLDIFKTGVSDSHAIVGKLARNPLTF